ncbi:MAG: 50S ribosomal protein L11 methyltransferase [Campylobacterales bacterium]|nr:50S ribosomal protein L11 methyltransferase [Campylobacterales bacterium]
MKEFYYELVVETSDFYELIENFLGDWCDAVIEENGKLVTTYEYEPVNVKEALLIYKGELEEMFGTKIILSAQISQKKNEDWIEAYKKGVEPIQIGNYYVYAPWHEPKAGVRNFLIEPSLAFGTGHHPTTKNAMLFVQKYVKKGDALLDVGCGSGILALTAADIGANVDLCDSDAEAVEVAKSVFEANNLSYQSIWAGSADEAKIEYDITVANIITDVLVMISKDLKKTLKKGGKLILSGILEENEAKLKAFYGDLTLLDRVCESEWVTLVYEKN